MGVGTVGILGKCSAPAEDGIGEAITLSADQRIILHAGNEEAGRTGGRICPVHSIDR
jgi:hypothetical protein